MGGEPTCQDRWEANPGLPLPRAWGLRLSITYINSGAQPGPICRPPPHLGSPRQPALARWWLGGVAVRGGPRSPSPHLAPPPTHAPNSCFSSFSPNLDYHPQVKKKKNQIILDLGSCWALRRAPAQDSPGPAPRPCSPRTDLIADDSQSCAGGLTAEATGPRRPQRRRGRALLHPPTLEEAGPPGSKASGDHAGSGKAAALPPL